MKDWQFLIANARCSFEKLQTLIDSNGRVENRKGQPLTTISIISEEVSV